MTFPFTNIPSGDTWRLPLFFAEIDPSHANSAQQTQRTLIVGQKVGGGTANLNTPQICPSQTFADNRYGPDSMVSRMFAKYRRNDPTGEVWCLALKDDNAAVAAVGSINFTHVATANGTLYLYIGGQKVTMPILSTQTAAQIATALVVAVNAIPTMPVTAAVDGSVTSTVDFTAVNAGAFGNDIDIRTNYLGDAGGESDPASLTYTIVPMATGATNPDLTTALANCMDVPFDFIVFPYTDTVSLNAMQSFLNDTTGRWSFNRQVFGHFLTALRGTVGALTTAGVARNDQHGSIMGFKNSPNPNDEWAAAVYGAAAVSLRNDPGRPLQFLAVQGLLAPPVASLFPDTDRNTLLHDGISTFIVQTDGTIQIENIISTYQLNAAGVPDNSYLQIETLFLLMFALRDLKSLVSTKFARFKLAADGTRFAPGAAIATPNMIRLELISLYAQRIYDGYFQSLDAFKANLIVEIDASNPNRINVLWPGTLIGQLRMFALLAQFRLQPQ